ncbi:hypothetical protein NQ314_002812 [Rhamnusium bicolor]|uniref:Uncharacterized protein n=1 Tax=Rhamnusium bicolor TaxID=1586634 RepID=A0AAV8ZQS1_9CUCU|nr:hypothetical protein NQ314_002812 [Rhamnusium bicolor]
MTVEPGSCVQRMIGSIKTGVILKDVSMTVHSGEVLAVLGSKGKDLINLRLHNMIFKTTINILNQNNHNDERAGSCERQ